MKLWLAGLMCVAFGVNGLFPTSLQTWIMPLWLCATLIVVGALLFVISSSESIRAKAPSRRQRKQRPRPEPLGQ